MRPLSELVRDNIQRLAPYSCARNEYSGETARVFLDANENPYNRPINRYPDPLQMKLKEAISRVKGVPVPKIFVGNGSDEAIDLLYRCFCEPKRDNVVAIEPTYGMYRVCADINDVEYRTVQLNGKFDLDADALLKKTDRQTKLIWLCSPNNPTGNTLSNDEIMKVLQGFDGLVVIDEAYIDFAQQRSYAALLPQFPNLVVMQTMSKAWGCAAIRLGMAFASEAIIDIFNKVKYPYNVNLLTQEKALEMLADPFEVDKWVNMITQEKRRLMQAFAQLPFCKRLFPSDSNFFLAEVEDAQKTYDYLVERGIIVRNRTNVTLCHNCLRITVGTRTENAELLAALRVL